jgi:hypothetical protein
VQALHAAKWHQAPGWHLVQLCWSRARSHHPQQHLLLLVLLQELLLLALLLQV